MSPEVAKRKIERMASYLRDLEAYRGIAFEEYGKHHYAVERLLLLLIQSAIDLASHLLADRGVLRPDSYRGVFAAAAESGLIDPVLAHSLERAVGLRNILVHEYEDIDDRIVWEAIALALADFRAFLAAMRRAVS